MLPCSVVGMSQHFGENFGLLLQGSSKFLYLESKLHGAKSQNMTVLIFSAMRTAHVHTYRRTYIHIYIYTHIHTYIHTYIYTYALFYVLLTVHLSIFIFVINQLDAQNLFYNKFIICLYMFRALCAHRQEVKIVLYSLWYHHTL